MGTSTRRPSNTRHWTLCVFVHVCMCACVFVHVCMCACVHVCMCVCVHGYVYIMFCACDQYTYDPLHMVIRL